MTEIAAKALMRLAGRMMAGRMGNTPVTIEAAGCRVTYDSSIAADRYTFRWSGEGWKCEVHVAYPLWDVDAVPVIFSGDEQRAVKELVMLALSID